MMHNYNQNNSQQNFNNNNRRGFSGNDSNMGGWPGNNSNSGGWPGNNNNSPRGFPGNNINNIQGFSGSNNSLGRFPNNNNNNNMGPFNNNGSNNIGGCLGNMPDLSRSSSNYNMQGFSGNNNSYMGPPFQNNNNNNNDWGSNSGRGDFWSSMNNDRNDNFNRRSDRVNSPPPLPALISGLLNNLSNAPNMLPYSNSGRDGWGPRGGGGGGRDSGPNRSSSSNYPPRSRIQQRDQPGRPPVRRERSRSNGRGRNDSAQVRIRQRDERNKNPVNNQRNRPQTTQQPKSQNKPKANLKRPAAATAAKTTATDAKKVKTDEKPKQEPRFPIIVSAVDYPTPLLDKEELVKLETAIIDEIAKGWDITPEFSGLYHKRGYLTITCKNEATAKWLEERAPQLEHWDGVELKACPREQFSFLRTVHISFPDSAGQDIQQVFDLVSAQNKDIETTSWAVASHRDEGQSLVTTILVDNASFEAIKKRDNFLNYRFDRVCLADNDTPQAFLKAANKAKQRQAKGKGKGKAGAGDIKESPKHPMVVTPVDYPEESLSDEELLELENAIIDEISKGWDTEPEFCGKYYKAGRLHLTCNNEATSKWLEERVANLENWHGVPLKALSKFDLPKVSILTVSFPGSVGQDVDKTIALVTAQNKDINTSAWKVLSHTDEDKSQVIKISVDAESVEAIKKKDNFLNYRFGRVSVSIKEQLVQAEPKAKESTEEPKAKEPTEEPKAEESAEKQNGQKAEEKKEEEQATEKVAVKKEVTIKTEPKTPVKRVTRKPKA